MKAMVFAAGFGTRLRPLTDRVPKPLVPVANEPLMSFAVRHLAGFGATRIVANAHHLAEQVVAAFPAMLPSGVSGEVVVESPHILGTGGGLRNAWQRALPGPGPVVVMNGDILFAPDLAGALEVHGRLGAVATMVLRSDPRASALGPVEVDGEGRVRRLLGLPVEGSDGLRRYMFTGVHILAEEAFADLPEDGCIIRQTYRRWVDSGAVVGAFVDDSPWEDLGTISDYWRANLDLVSGRRAVPGVSPRGGNVVPQSAVVEAGAVVRRSVLGAGVTVRPGVRVEDAVVWRGATVTSSVERAVVLPDLVVPVPPETTHTGT